MIIGLSGKRGSGKSTFAKMLIDCGFKEISFADPMKRFCKEVFDFTDEQLYGPSEARNKIDLRWGISPRVALQTLGTEWGRNLHPDVWAVAAIRTATEWPHAVISDCRFPNELRTVRNAHGILIRIKRDADYIADAHASETSLDDVPDSFFQHVVDNNGPLAQLKEQLYAIVAEHTF